MNRLHIIRLLLSLSLAALLVSCGKPPETETSLSAAEIADNIWTTQAGPAEPYTLNMEDADFSTYLTAYYVLEADLLTDGAIRYAGGTDASEVAVFAVKDDADIALVEAALLRYIETRMGDFYGYMPEQVFVLEKSAVATAGSHVALLICPEPEEAQSAFSACFREGAALQAPQRETPVEPQPSPAIEPDPEPEPGQAQREEIREGYDADAILAAWRAQDPSSLSGKNRTILEVSAGVIDELVTPSMTDAEKELAVHDWIIQWAEYDVDTNDHAPDAEPGPDSDNPYGLLVERRAICTGYTRTFQLFMDMLGIECITVNGWAISGENEHSWNMVRLDGEWYCVDVTWNDPVGLERYDAEIQHEFFNVTSEEMRESDHQWDVDKVPEATATTYRWAPA